MAKNGILYTHKTHTHTHMILSFWFFVCYLHSYSDEKKKSNDFARILKIYIEIQTMICGPVYQESNWNFFSKKKKNFDNH